MKVLIVNSGKSKFVIGENNVEPENLSRADLLMILTQLSHLKNLFNPLIYQCF